MRLALSNLKPVVHDDAFVHKDAFLLGNVNLSQKSNVWNGATVRGSQGPITIGEGTNLQSDCVVQSSGKDAGVEIGRYSTIGKGVILNGCEIGDHCVIGDGAVILEDAVVGDWSIIGPGSLVESHMVIPSRSVVFGHPAKVQGTIDDHAKDFIVKSAQAYVHKARKY